MTITGEIENESWWISSTTRWLIQSGTLTCCTTMAWSLWRRRRTCGVCWHICLLTTSWHICQHEGVPAHRASQDGCHVYIIAKLLVCAFSVLKHHTNVASLLIFRHGFKALIKDFIEDERVTHVTWIYKSVLKSKWCVLSVDNILASAKKKLVDAHLWT